MLTTLCLYAYELPLTTNFSKSSLTTRKGIILEDPTRGIFSESAPLPGYSRESYLQALSQLHSLLHPLLAISSPQQLATFFKQHTLYPSVLFAIHSLFDELFYPSHYPCVFPIRHCIDIPYQNPSSCQTLLDKVLSLHTDTSSTLKIKLGSYPISAAIPLMRSLLSSCHARIQLDINQMWSLEDMLHFCRAFEEGSFDQIEDPVSSISDLFTLAKHSPHPISLDHLLRTHSIHDVLHLPSLKACEFKPTLDMHTLLDDSLLRTLEDRGIHYTLSSSYESSIGIAAIGRLGQKNIPSSCLGIDTLSIFSHDILISPVDIKNTTMIINKPLQPNWTLLQYDGEATLASCTKKIP